MDKTGFMAIFTLEEMDVFFHYAYQKS